MQKKKAANHDDFLMEQLRNPEFAAHYLNEAFLDTTAGAKERLLEALFVTAQSYGVSKLTSSIGQSPKALYKSLSPEKGNPTLETLLAIFNTLNLQLMVAPKPQKKSRARRAA